MPFLMTYLRKKTISSNDEGQRDTICEF